MLPTNMNQSIKRVVLTVVAVSLFSAGANAQQNGQCRSEAAGGQTSADQTFCFEPENVAGSLVGATGQTVRPMRGLRGPSLIRLRGHFVPEMLKGVENL
jgi:hypothetical protein